MCGLWVDCHSNFVSIRSQSESCRWGKKVGEFCCARKEKKMRKKKEKSEKSFWVMKKISCHGAGVLRAIADQNRRIQRVESTKTTMRRGKKTGFRCSCVNITYEAAERQVKLNLERWAKEVAMEMDEKKSEFVVCDDSVGSNSICHRMSSASFVVVGLVWWHFAWSPSKLYEPPAWSTDNQNVMKSKVLTRNPLSAPSIVSHCWAARRCGAKCRNGTRKCHTMPRHHPTERTDRLFVPWVKRVEHSRTKSRSHFNAFRIGKLCSLFHEVENPLFLRAPWKMKKKARSTLANFLLSGARRRRVAEV